MQNQKVVFLGSVFVLFFACLFGGGQGFFGDVIAQLAAIFLLAVCLFNRESELHRASTTKKRLVYAFIAIVFLVPVLQLYPWQASGAYALKMQQDMLQAGVPLSGISLHKTYGAERALFFLLPACALFIATLQLSWVYRQRVLMALGVIVLLNILLGFAQLAQGINSPLRLYAITNTFEAVGFFANRNHFASLLAMCLPLIIAATAWWAHLRFSRQLKSPILIIGGAIFCILIILAIAVSRSRAGLLLGMLGFVLMLPALFALPRQPGFKRLLGVIVVVGALASIQFAFVGLMKRADQGIIDDTRTEMTLTSIEAGKAFAPMGSGLGTFRDAYQPFELKAGNLENTLTNHAHNDYAELWMETGYPGLFAIGTFWLLFLIVGFRLWYRQKQGATVDILLSRAAWIGALLVLLHSYVDYPLRTTANASVFAVLLALALSVSLRKSRTDADKG